MDKTGIGDRMKGYEHISKTFLPKRTPVIIRLDGKAFHTFTKGLDRPYDVTLHRAMNAVALALCNQIQGAVFAYTQSDEISILLRDYDTFTTEGWYNYNVQKMVSVSAAIATAEFNRIFTHPTHPRIALFDSRVFSLSKEEVTNYFVWRQQDATRNSINMLAQHHFNHKQLQGKNVNDVQDMLMNELDPAINWNDQSIWAKRGSCVVEEHSQQADFSPPIFTQDRDYVERHLAVRESKILSLKTARKTFPLEQRPDE